MINGIGSYHHRGLIAVYTLYILASRKHGTLYIGVTNNLIRRVYEHRSDSSAGFSARYHVHLLVWFECYDDAISAITREKSLRSGGGSGRST